MIKVNNVAIPESAILEEMQYHPAESKRQAMLKAAAADAGGSAAPKKRKKFSMA